MYLSTLKTYPNKLARWLAKNLFNSSINKLNHFFIKYC